MFKGSVRKHQQETDKRLAKIETRLKQLECPHEHKEFREGEWIFWFYEVCKDCGKVIQVFDSEAEFLRAKLDRVREENVGLGAAIEEELAGLEEGQ